MELLSRDYTQRGNKLRFPSFYQTRFVTLGLIGLQRLTTVEL